MCSSFLECVRSAYSALRSSAVLSTEVVTEDDAVWIYPTEIDVAFWRDVYASPDAAFACADEIVSPGADVIINNPKDKDLFVFLRRSKC